MQIFNKERMAAERQREVDKEGQTLGSSRGRREPVRFGAACTRCIAACTRCTPLRRGAHSPAACCDKCGAQPAAAEAAVMQQRYAEQLRHDEAIARCLSDSTAACAFGDSARRLPAFSKIAALRTILTDVSGAQALRGDALTDCFALSRSLRSPFPSVL